MSKIVWAKIVIENGGQTLTGETELEMRVKLDDGRDMGFRSSMSEARGLAGVEMIDALTYNLCKAIVALQRVIPDVYL